MKDMGSKIAVLIIVFVMIFLASLLHDSVGGPDMMASSSTPINQLPYTEANKTVQEKSDATLTFEHFPTAESVFSGKTVAPDITNPVLEPYKDIITKSVQASGVNYAGQYAIATWSCGEDCQYSVIADVKTGSIVNDGILTAYGLSYSPDSTLLIVNPEENLPQDSRPDVSYVTDYYTLSSDGNLALVAKKVKGENVIDGCLSHAVHARNPLTNEVFVFETPCKVPFGWHIIDEVQ